MKQENLPWWKDFKSSDVKKLTIIVALTKKLEEAEKVTRKFIIRHHFLIWAEYKANVNPCKRKFKQPQ